MTAALDKYCTGKFYSPRKLRKFGLLQIAPTCANPSPMPHVLEEYTIVQHSFRIEETHHLPTPQDDSPAALCLHLQDILLISCYARWKQPLKENEFETLCLPEHLKCTFKQNSNSCRRNEAGGPLRRPYVALLYCANDATSVPSTQNQTNSDRKSEMKII